MSASQLFVPMTKNASVFKIPQLLKISEINLRPKQLRNPDALLVEANLKCHSRNPRAY